MQQLPESSLSHLMALRRFGNNIGNFWRIIVYVGVLLALVSILVDKPGFYMAPRGWLAIVLAVSYLAAFTAGSRWIAGKSPDTYWKTRLNTGHVLHPWRAVALWGVLLTLSIVMISLNSNFVWLIWIPYGMSFSLLPMPRCLLLVIPTALLTMSYYAELPTNFTPPELLRFAGFAFGFACYSAVIYLPMMLLRTRFQRERMYFQLEQSHHELEEAHQQLEQAAVHERELAVLRERGRLARDIHDTLGHSLALMTVKLEAAQRLRAVDPARADHEVAATQAIARDALAELRAAIANLRAPGNTHECLNDALLHSAQEIAARTGWQLNCDIVPDLGLMSNQACEALLRTSIEALANIERHANAQCVRITLLRQDDTVVLRIEDDGVGIMATNPPRRVGVPISGSTAPADDPSEATSEDEITSPHGHYGITGMRERTAGVGGTFLIGAGTDGHGTCVEVRLPATV